VCVSQDWTPAEQISLDNLLQQYPAEKFISSLQRYVQVIVPCQLMIVP
jgi:hypothetical protein